MIVPLGKLPYSGNSEPDSHMKETATTIRVVSKNIKAFPHANHLLSKDGDVII